MLRWLGRAWRWTWRALAVLFALATLPGYIADMSAKPTFQMVEIEPGRRLHVHCAGPEGAPFALYDAGAFGVYADGWWVQQALQADVRVCLYDRAGMGWSDPPPAGVAPSPDFHVEDMRKLARAVGAAPPYTLIGHSMSGVRLHGFANLHPDEVAGLVLVDAAAPQRFNSERGRRLVGLFKTALGVGAFTARIGLARAVSGLIPDELDLPPAQSRDKRRSLSWVRHHKAAAAEIGAADLDATYLKGVNAERIPLAVFTNSAGGGGNGAFVEAAERNTGYGRLHVLPDETHVSFLNRRGAERIATAVREIRAAGETAAAAAQ